jgi:thioredoxin-dependent peroxiredoxin
MSKKTRKKSPQRSSGKPARGQSMRSAKTPSSKIPPPTAGRSGHSASEQLRNASLKASQNAPSKPLKSSSRRDFAPRAAARSKATVAKAEPANPSARKKTVGKKIDAAAPANPALIEGAWAPAFRLPRDGGDTVSLSDYAGKKLVLFFYPRADTPGCTKEAIDFTRLASAFAESQTAILGVSADPPRTQEAFRDKHRLSVPLVSDEKHEMLEAYGVWGEKSMYGRTFQGTFRTTVLVGADGKIIKIWRHVRVDGHADEVLAAARAA